LANFPKEILEAIVSRNLQARGTSIQRIRKKDLTRPAAKWVSKNRLRRGTGDALAVVLATSGCNHARSDTGGCIMCSYLLDGSAERPTSEQLVEQFQVALREIDGREAPLAIKVYTSGSFLDPDEVPLEARDEIIRLIAADDRVHEVVLESRPEFATEASMVLLRKVGMRQEAHFRESLWVGGAWVDDVVFGVLASEWPPR